MVGLSAVRAVHVLRPFPVSAYVRGRLENLRHLASARLTCVELWVSFGIGRQIAIYEIVKNINEKA